MSTISIAIEVTTDSNVSAPEWGLLNGVFRWCTGDKHIGGPGDAYPILSCDTGPTDMQYLSGVISQDGLGDITRSVDISRSGGYSALSGCKFSVLNVNQFWKFIEDNAINLTNRTVRIFAAIADGAPNLGFDMRQIYQGVIVGSGYDMGEHLFEVEDAAKTLHKPVPPESSPVVIGDVPRVNISENLTITNSSMDLVKRGSTWYTCTAAYEYTDQYQLNWDTPRLRLWVSAECGIEHDALVGKYLRVVGKDDIRLIRITSNHSQLTSDPYVDIPDGQALVWVNLAQCLPVSQSDFNEFYAYKMDQVEGASDDTYWFEIVDLNLTADISSSEVYKVVEEGGRPVLYAYDEETDSYRDVSDLVDVVDTAGGTTSISISAKTAESDGTLSYYSILPGITADNPKLLDLDRSTTHRMKLYYEANMRGIIEEIELSIDPSKDYSAYDELYLSCDFDILAPDRYHEFLIEYELYDIFGKKVTDWGSETDDLYLGLTNSRTSFNLLPNELYKGGDDNDELSLWDRTYNFGGVSGNDDHTVSSAYTLPTDIIDQIKSGKVSKLKVKLVWQNVASEHTEIEVWIKQVALFGSKEFAVEGDLYTSVEGGEMTSDGTPSSSVYGAFRLMLERYDGLTADQIDYRNLQTARSSWKCGRKLIDRQSSQDYMNELALQSFVAIYPTRTGKRGLCAWRELDSTADHAGDYTMDDGIIKGSVKPTETTPIFDLFNEYLVKYGYDPGSDSLREEMRITRIDDSTFPGIDGDWQLYVSGVPSYADAKELWEACHEAYIMSKTHAELPNNLSTLNWYTASGTGVFSSAYRYLQNVVSWTSRRKSTVEFDVPLTVANIESLELLKIIGFGDFFYTGEEDGQRQIRTGWVTGLTIKPLSARISVQMMYWTDPSDEEVIIETGTATEYHETGDADVIAETGV